MRISFQYVFGASHSYISMALLVACRCVDLTLMLYNGYHAPSTKSCVKGTRRTNYENEANVKLYMQAERSAASTYEYEWMCMMVCGVRCAAKTTMYLNHVYIGAGMPALALSPVWALKWKVNRLNVCVGVSVEWKNRMVVCVNERGRCRCLHI